MSEVDAHFVKRGFWINVEQGPVMGRTITTDIEAGTVIIALLAILSSLAIGHLWNVCLFAYHQIRAHGRPADGLYRQQQALLRTLPPPSSLLADWTKLWWLWRKNSKRALTRSLPPASIALGFTVAKIAVGIFSSYIVASTNLQVLVDSPLCGPLDLDPMRSNFSDNLDGIFNYRREFASRSLPFSKECYQNETSLPTRCLAFIQPNLPLMVERMPCPFDQKICPDAENPAVSIDSGLVDLNNIFGWNLQSKDRVLYRRRATCGILRTDGYFSIINASDWPVLGRDPLPGEQRVLLHYGNISNWVVPNVTFSYNLLEATFKKTYGRGVFPVMLKDEWNLPYDSATLLPELKTDNADQTLVSIIKNKVGYTVPVNDPFFSAHQPIPFEFYTGIGRNNGSIYASDSPHSVLTCRQQHQFCHASNNTHKVCTDLTGLPGSAEAMGLSGANDVQLAALQLLVTISYLFDTSDAVTNLLEVADKLDNSGYIASLPDDQWVREVLGWEKFIWASKQTMASDYAIGYGAKNPSIQNYVRKNITAGERKLCQVQRMRKAGGFMNINVFGLTFIITFSVIITAVDLVLLKFLIFLGKVRRALNPGIDRWIQDGVFQLQRQVYESREQGVWDRLEKEIPITAKGDLLDELPLGSSPAPQQAALLTWNTATTQDEKPSATATVTGPL